MIAGRKKQKENHIDGVMNEYATETDMSKDQLYHHRYNRAYKAHYARYMKKKMTVAEFEQWSRFASELRDKALADEVIFEEYLKEIRR